MQGKSKYLTRLSTILMFSALNPAFAVNNAPADAAVVNVRTNCTEGGVEVTNCFTSISAMDNWLRNVRQAGPTKPTLVQIGPGTFGSWTCQVSNVTLRGSGRDQTTISGQLFGSLQGILINAGCTNLNVQDLKVVGGSLWGVVTLTADLITAWTNVDIESSSYGWTESGPTCSPSARHFWFSSRIRSTGANGDTSRAYQAVCAQSWFWGSEISAIVPTSLSAADSFALKALGAEVHLYGSNVSVKIASGANAGNVSLIRSMQENASKGSEVHIHGTGLDVIHAGSGNVKMLDADASSQFHANQSAYHIHIDGSGSVTRLAGQGMIDAPYQWGPRTAPPPVTSRSGADMYTETDCPLNGHCSAGGNFPHIMVYRAECTGTGVNQGPWFDTSTKACRQ